MLREASSEFRREYGGLHRNAGAELAMAGCIDIGCIVHPRIGMVAGRYVWVVDIFGERGFFSWGMLTNCGCATWRVSVGSASPKAERGD